MNDNTNPEINTEEIISAAEESVESTSEVADATEIGQEAVDEVSEVESNSQNTELVEEEPESIITEEEAPVKKKFPIQIPVIIAACLVVATLLGYFIFTGFFLKEPEGVTWSTDLEGATYYFDFNNDNTFKAYVGSVEISGTYEKTKSETDGNTLTVNSTVCNFYGGAPATYEISGSRILGNQKLDFSYGEGYNYSLTQASRKKIDLELPADFVADEDLLGEWVFQYYGYDIYKVTFNNNGSMILEFPQDGFKYNGTYTVEDGTVNFTFYVSDNVVTPLEYSINGDTLNFLGATFVRADSITAADLATADEPGPHLTVNE